MSYDPNQLRQGEWYVKANGIIVSIYDSDRLLADTLECVSECREMQFRVVLTAYQGGFTQA